MTPFVRTTAPGRSRFARKMIGAGAAAGLLVLGPLGAAAAFGATHTTSTTRTADNSAPQCQLFGPIEGGIQQFEQQWNASVPSGAPKFGNPLPDIAAQLAAITGCAPTSPSAPTPPSPPGGGGGAPSGLPSGVPSAPGAPGGGSGSGGSGSAPQCALFDPVTGGLQQVENAWNTNSGQYTFTGSNDVAAAIDNGAGCSGTKPLVAPSGSGSGSSGGSGGSGSAPQCQLFTPLEGGIEQVEQQIDTNSGGQNPFAGSNDIAQQMASKSGCPITTSGSGSGSGSGNNTSGSGGGNTSGTTQGGSSDGTTSSSSSGGTDSGGGAATAADFGTGSSGTSGSGGALAFTGEPSWIPLAGVLLLILAGLSGLVAIGMRVVARQRI